MNYPNFNETSRDAVSPARPVEDREVPPEVAPFDTMMTHLLVAGGLTLARISKWIDAAPANAARDREAATWGRLAKIQEEAGEVIAAYISETGQNPRKAVDPNAADRVNAELLDVALTALAALEHRTGNHGQSMVWLLNHIREVAIRAGV